MIGYVGAALVIVAGSYTIAIFVPHISTGAEIAFAAVVTALLLAGGEAVRPGSEPSLGRLRTVLWLLSVLSLTVLTGLLTSRVWHLSALSGDLVTAGAGTAYAFALWLRMRSALLAIAVFVDLALTVAFALARIDSHLSVWQFGLALWLLSAGWVLAAYAGYARPAVPSYICGGLGLLAGAQLMAVTAPGLAVALATVAGLLAAGVALHRVALVGVGAAGVIQFVPQAAVRYLPHTISALSAVFAVGVILLGVALWLARSRRARHT